jgi:hypothetical protein
LEINKELTAELSAARADGNALAQIHAKLDCEHFNLKKERDALKAEVETVTEFKDKDIEILAKDRDKWRELSGKLAEALEWYSLNKLGKFSRTDKALKEYSRAVGEK